MEIILNRHTKVSRNKSTAKAHGLIQLCCPLLMEEAQNKDHKKNLTVLIYLSSGINQTLTEEITANEISIITLAKLELRSGLLDSFNLLVKHPHLHS